MGFWAFIEICTLCFARLYPEEVYHGIGTGPRCKGCVGKHLADKKREDAP